MLHRVSPPEGISGGVIYLLFEEKLPVRELVLGELLDLLEEDDLTDDVEPSFLRVDDDEDLLLLELLLDDEAEVELLLLEAELVPLVLKLPVLDDVSGALPVSAALLLLELVPEEEEPELVPVVPVVPAELDVVPGFVLKLPLRSVVAGLETSLPLLLPLDDDDVVPVPV
ncbi:hypothetical protein [Paenibacillus sp. y28]|uniref:hypothetical protein n=1 Tax=Paenibacillus sp. y28 TaxID=3129110 RepID=UPI003017D300